MRLLCIVLVVLLCAAFNDAFAQDVCPIERDKHGKIKRSSSQLTKFKKMTGYPNGRPGYIIDHIKPLACGGCDKPSNMQWQTIPEAKAKDKWERKMCGDIV